MPVAAAAAAATATAAAAAAATATAGAMAVAVGAAAAAAAACPPACQPAWQPASLAACQPACQPVCLSPVCGRRAWLLHQMLIAVYRQLRSVLWPARWFDCLASLPCRGGQARVGFLSAVRTPSCTKAAELWDRAVLVEGLGRGVGKRGSARPRSQVCCPQDVFRANGNLYDDRMATSKWTAFTRMPNLMTKVMSSVGHGSADMTSAQCFDDGYMLNISACMVCDQSCHESCLSLTAPNASPPPANPGHAGCYTGHGLPPVLLSALCSSHLDATLCDVRRKTGPDPVP